MTNASESNSPSLLERVVSLKPSWDLGLASVLFAGCATGPMFQPVAAGSPDKSVIYLYRNRALMGSGNAMRIHANGKHITNLGNGTYYPFVAEAGTVAFSGDLEFKAWMLTSPLALGLTAGANSKKELLTLETQPGSTQFLRLKWFDKKQGPTLSQVHENQALSEIGRCRLANEAPVTKPQIKTPGKKL